MAITNEDVGVVAAEAVYATEDARLSREAFAARLKELIGSRSLSKIADASGVSVSSLRNATRAKFEMSRDRLIAVARELGTTVEFLATGQHPYQAAPGTEDEEDSIFLSVLAYNELLADVRPKKQLKNVRPVNPATLGAGRVKIGLTKAFFEEHHVQPASVRVVACQGDAMDPFIHNGDFLLVDVSPNQPVMEGVYLLTVSNSLTLRRLAATPAGLTAVPDNARYQPFKLTLDEDGYIMEESVEPIGRVFWVLRGVTP